MNVRTLGPTDTGAAFRLSQQAGWGIRRADWRLLLSAEAVVAIGGRRENDLVATATVAQYGEVGWVGCVLVDEAYRRRGLGTEIFGTACEAADAAILGLDANPAGKPIYEEHGFSEVTTVRQYRGDPDADRGSRVREMEPAERDDLVSFDRSRTGVDRGWLLRARTADSETRTFVHCDGELEGYALLTPDRQGWNLGPLVADAPETASALVRRAAAETDGEVTVRVPDAPTVGDVRWEELGFTLERELERMVRPPRSVPLAGGAVRAILSYAFG